MFGVFLAVIFTEITVFLCAVYSVKVLLLKTEVLIPRYLESHNLNFITGAKEAANQVEDLILDWNWLLEKNKYLIENFIYSFYFVDENNE